ncbi:CES5A.2 family protein [Megaselia abdita]
MSMLSWYVIAAVCLLSGDVLTSDSELSELSVQLKHGGSLIGTTLKSYSGRQIRTFLGIPYAKPPVGELRFKSPVPFPPWQGVRNATEDGSQCFQMGFLNPLGPPEGSEDCLTLNVYTPPLYRIPKEGLPVMVNIHGGGWLGGSNDHRFFSPSYILDEDVILVSINYRVGVLGFLSTETLDCPGNFGLKDQVEALRWVKEYISEFGGNKNSVTIFGASAGGASVSHLLQSKTANGLFHRAIPQSGNILNPWSQPLHKGEAPRRTLKLAEMLNCSNEEKNWKDIAGCLKNLDASVLVSKTNSLTDWNGYPYFIFQPTLEPSHPEAFIDERPRDVDWNSQDIPILIGMTSGEGIMSTAALLSSDEILKEVKRDVSNKFPLMLGYDHFDKDKQKDITDELEKFYLKNGHSYDKNNHKNFTDMFTDSLFLAGFDEYLKKRLSSKAAPTYVYIFDMKVDNSVSQIVGGGDTYYGVAHGDDIQFLFPFYEFFGKKSELKGNSLVMKNALVEMLVNFASYGNPTPHGSRFEKWEPATKYPWNYVRMGVIDDEGFHVFKNEENYASDRFDFWRTLQPHVEH